MKAWHFLPKDRRLTNGDGRRVEAGQTLTVEGELLLCKHGLHGCRRARDVLAYATGPVIERVELGGKIIEGIDKAVASERTCLWWADAADALHEFTCRCAEDALALVEEPDPRSLAAIEVKRKWLRGEIGVEELDAAKDAAKAAMYVAEDATYAAWQAAKAAMHAATDAVPYTARKAANEAVYTVGDAAKDGTYAPKRAARAKQNRRLTAMLSALPLKEPDSA